MGNFPLSKSVYLTSMIPNDISSVKYKVLQTILAFVQNITFVKIFMELYKAAFSDTFEALGKSDIGL